MTEYDFSPEAYQAHLANMERISRWVDRTEEHRSEFANATGLTEEPRKRSSLSGRRRAPPPPPLPLPPYGAPDPGYAMGMGTSPQHSSGMYSGVDFAYASGPGSPGPMPPNTQPMYAGHALPHPPFMMVSPPPSPLYHDGRSRRSRSSSFSFALPPPMPGPPPFYPFGAHQPGYVILPPTPARGSAKRHSRRPSVSYVYV